MKKLFLVVCLLFPVLASAQVQCDFRMSGNDGTNGFLFKNSDGRGSVVLLPKWLGEACETVKIFRRRPVCRRPDQKCRFVRRVANLRFTGFANGDRQHWRDDRRIEQICAFATRGKKRNRCRRFTVQCDFGEFGDRLCWNLKRVDSERND